MATGIGDQERVSRPVGVGAAMGFSSTRAPQIFVTPGDGDHDETPPVHDGCRLLARRATEPSRSAPCVVAPDHLHDQFLEIVLPYTEFSGEFVLAQFGDSAVRCDAAPEPPNGMLEHVLDTGIHSALGQCEPRVHSITIPPPLAERALHAGRALHREHLRAPRTAVYPLPYAEALPLCTTLSHRRSMLRPAAAGSLLTQDRGRAAFDPSGDHIPRRGAVRDQHDGDVLAFGQQHRRAWHPGASIGRCWSRHRTS